MPSVRNKYECENFNTRKAPYCDEHSGSCIKVTPYCRDPSCKNVLGAVTYFGCESDGHPGENYLIGMVSFNSKQTLKMSLYHQGLVNNDKRLLYKVLQFLIFRL